MPSLDIKTVYMMGIGGIAMGTLATMLKEKKYRVVGSDLNVYPPMSTHLETSGIPVLQGYKAENLTACEPDMVVIGNVIRRDNPEAQYVVECGIPYVSMPEALTRFFLTEPKSMVIAGTHGKSTTSSLLSWVLESGGMDPNAFVGAFLKNWQRSYRLGNGPYMVLEGDEYDTAFFDKGPKFLHYKPHVAVITSIEYDHADIFPDFESMLGAFRSLVRIIPKDGYLIINADDPHCLALSAACEGKVITYGASRKSDWRLLDVGYLPQRVEFEYINPESRLKETMTSRLAGLHNVGNALAVMAASSVAGLSMSKVQDAFMSFEGVKRRQEVVGRCNDILIIDDFAHHPTAAHETINGLKLYYPGCRLIAAFEPRTNSSRRRIFQDAYVPAFDGADCACIKQPPGLEAIPDSERMDARQLVQDIRSRRKDAYYFEDTDGLIRFLIAYGRPGDVMLCMSNGSFDGLPRKLLQALSDNSHGTAAQ